MPAAARIWNVISTVLDRVLEIALYVLLAFMLVQVFLRYVLHTGLPWTNELIQTIFIYLSFIGAATVLRRQGHLGLDILVRLVPRAGLADRLVYLWGNLVHLLCGLALLAAGGSLVLLAARGGYRTSLLEIPYAVVYLAIPMSGLMFVLSTALLGIGDPRRAGDQLTAATQTEEFGS